MKTCRTCHLVYEDRFIFCTRDGTILNSSGTTSSKLEINTLDTPHDKPDKESAVGFSAEKSELRMMYCPACGMEYPLTFTICPSDLMPLRTKKPRPVLAMAQSIQVIQEETAVIEHHPLVIPADTESEIEVESEVESIENLIESEESSISIVEPAYEDQAIISLIEDQHQQPSYEPVPEVHTSSVLEDYYSPTPKGYETAPLGPANPEVQFRTMQMAAKAIVIGLAALTIIASYLVYDAGSPAPPVSEAPIPQELLVAQAPVFIPTPEEARNYSEESVEEQPNETKEAREEDTGKEQQPIRSGQEREIEPLAQKPIQSQPPERVITPATKSEVRAPREVETGPVIPQSTEGRISSRLVRTRSNRIGSGVRYDLTFALEEQTGRTVKWDKMLISTRSARGVNQSQTVPFYHRQGASGSLTFTVSVVMKGGSDADWRGRVVCTTVGTDERGRALQARFGATVTPR